jgi:hypothetical protein
MIEKPKQQMRSAVQHASDFTSSVRNFEREKREKFDVAVSQKHPEILKGDKAPSYGKRIPIPLFR